MSQIGNKAFRDDFSLLTYSWWFYNSPEIRFGGVAMTSDAHEATEWTMLSHIQLLSFVCLFVCFRGGGLKTLSQGRGNGNRETITGKKKFNTNLPLICRRSCSPSSPNISWPLWLMLLLTLCWSVSLFAFLVRDCYYQVIWFQSSTC